MSSSKVSFAAIALVALACGCSSSTGATSSGTSSGSASTTGSSSGASSGSGGATTGATTTGGATSGTGTTSGGSSTGGGTSSGSTSSGGTTGGTNVSVTLTNRPTDSTAYSFLVASQDGTDAWKLAPAPSGDTYTFPVSSTEWGFVWACIAPGNRGRYVNEVRFLTAERTSLTATISSVCTDRLPGDVPATVTIPASTGSGYVELHYGDRSSTVDASDMVAISTPPGTYDLVLLHHGLTDLNADWAIVKRNVGIVAGIAVSIMGPIENTQSFPVTVGGTGMPIVETHLYTANGTSAQVSGSTASPFTTVSLPVDYMVATDVYDQIITVNDTGSSAATDTWTATPAAQTFDPPMPLGTVAVQVPSSSPYPVLSATWTAYAGAIGYSWYGSQGLTATQCGGSNSCFVAWSAMLSPGVVGSPPGFQMPDLSGLTGWSASFQFVSGTAVGGSVRVDTSSSGATDFPIATPAPSGTNRSWASTYYSVTP